MLTAREIYNMLYRFYGKPQWWSDNPYQIMVEAILVKQTAWTSVEKMRPVMKDHLLPLSIQAFTQEKLEELIRHCGLNNQRPRQLRPLPSGILTMIATSKLSAAGRIYYRRLERTFLYIFIGGKR